MARIEDGKSASGNQSVDPTKAARVCVTSRSLRNFCVAETSGTIAAALAANSSVFAMRLDPSAGNLRAFIERVRVQWTAIAAFTTPVTAARRLALFRGSGAAASGGTAVAAVGKKHSAGSDSEFDAANGGDVRIATTGALTVTGITFESTPLRVVSLVHVGAAGAFYEGVLEFAATESAPLILEAGQVLALRNPAAMDAGGTWQVAVCVDWHEATLLDATVDS